MLHMYVTRFYFFIQITQNCIQCEITWPLFDLMQLELGEQSYQNLVNDSYRILKPGGYLEIAEPGERPFPFWCR
jgi:predicted SAM-dependent methyltransferase